MPKDPGLLLADNNTLLHEMIHQLLFECGEPAGHDSDGWRREIMRLTKLITGKEIWTGRSMTKRVKGTDGKLSKVVRISELHEDGRASLLGLSPACGEIRTPGGHPQFQCREALDCRAQAPRSSR